MSIVVVTSQLEQTSAGVELQVLQGISTQETSKSGSDQGVLCLEQLDAEGGLSRDANHACTQMTTVLALFLVPLVPGSRMSKFKHYNTSTFAINLTRQNLRVAIIIGARDFYFHPLYDTVLRF